MGYALKSFFEMDATAQIATLSMLVAAIVLAAIARDARRW